MSSTTQTQSAQLKRGRLSHRYASESTGGKLWWVLTVGALVVVAVVAGVAMM